MQIRRWTPLFEKSELALKSKPHKPMRVKWAQYTELWECDDDDAV